MRGVWAKVLMKTIEFEHKVRKTMTKEKEKLNFQKHENTLAWTF